MYESIETDIVNRLSSLSSSGIEVVALPEVEAQLKRPFANGKVTVMYVASKGGKQLTISVMSQEEKLSFQIGIQSRKLRGSKGIYSIMDAVKARLLGYGILSTSNKLYLEDAKFESHEADLWTYSMTFTVDHPIVELPDDESLNISRKLSMEDEENVVQIDVESDEYEPPAEPEPES